MKLLLPFLTILLLLQGCAGGLIVVAGTAVAVASDERTVSTIIEDDRLAVDALNLINELDINKDEIRINLITNNGYLLVIGQANNEQQKQMISDELNTLKNVKEVYNQLRIGPTIGFTQQSKDSWITTKTKSKLTAHEDVNAFQIKVVTENSEVFLIGRVDKKTADAATNISRQISGVKHVNRVFQMISE
ncbi:BON domain-containing protein [Psychromonas sp. KJ10-10]|uniref:BON domain-containing protein n=1 Tax=Psychromonas sp. KJ10-10 TaxID=3391823 RepID=UPI0039B5719B